MKTWKLVSGILSIAMSLFVVFQSCAAGISNALIVLFGLAALVGFLMAGSYVDLNIWAGWCLICAVFGLIALIRSGKKAE